MDKQSAEPEPRTPGPWYVTTCMQGDGCWCRCVVTDPNSDSLDDCVIPSGSVNAANARLIAAAPDLLALVYEYAAGCSMCDGKGAPEFGAFSGKPCPDCEDARALIAKATGEIRLP